VVEAFMSISDELWQQIRDETDALDKDRKRK
jgi:hypothetical protein